MSIFSKDKDATSTSEKKTFFKKDDGKAIVKSSSKPDYRDVSGKGGYVYRQYSDGTLQIVQSPRGGSGTTVPTGSQAYVTIIKEIGPYPGSINPATGKKWTSAEWAQVAAAGASAITAALTHKRKHKRKKGAVEALPIVNPEPVSETPPWLVPAVLAAGGIGLVLMLKGGGGNAPPAPHYETAPDRGTRK
jgi:hypothetical protein